MFGNYFTGCLLTCANDFKIVLMRVMSAEETSHGNLSDNKRLLVSLMEPTIEFIMKCIFKNMSEVCTACSNNTCLRHSILNGYIQNSIALDISCFENIGSKLMWYW